MERWAGFILVGVLLVAFVIGTFIEPTDGETIIDQPSWQAKYYNNVALEGDPVLERFERNLSYNWAEAAPIGVNQDNFSVVWEGDFDFDTGTYNFVAGADDGIRVWVDDELIIDQWESGDQFNVYAHELDLLEGEHNIRVNYYDAEGLAGINVRWNLVEDVPEVVDDNNADQDENGINPDANESPPTAVPPVLPPNTVGHVATGNLNVYSGPGIQQARIGQVFLYQKFPITGSNNDGSWYQLDLRDGRTGWVESDFVFLTGQLNIPIITTNLTGNATREEGLVLNELSLRDNPEASDEVIGMIVEDAQIEVLGRSNDSKWYLVRYGELEGWALGIGIELEALRPQELPFMEPVNDQ